jgi:hypothetical protein
MIIFDLDGTLANCEHRRHFVEKNDGKLRCGENWKPDWDAFHEACDKDTPIEPVLDVFIHLTQGEPFNHDVQIWSGRCESVREKTLKWLVNLTGYCEDYRYWERRLKMRPIGDSTPDDILKEKWLDEALSEGKKIDFVFDDRPKVVRMWRRRSIFVFNCNQSDEEF